MRETMASGGPRPFLTKLLLTLILLLVPASASAVGDVQIGPNAAIQAFKLKFGYTNEAAYITARTASYRSAGVRLANVADGEFFYRQSDNTMRCYDGTAPYNAAHWAACGGGGGGGTLDAAYTAGQTITRDLNSLSILDATVNATATMYLERSAGTGAGISVLQEGIAAGVIVTNNTTGSCFQALNTGGGPEISGSGWNVTSNIFTGQGVTVQDALGVSNYTLGNTLGAGSPITLNADFRYSEAIWIPAGSFGPAITNGAKLENAGGIGLYQTTALAYDDTTDEYASTSFMLPYWADPTFKACVQPVWSTGSIGIGTDTVIWTGATNVWNAGTPTYVAAGADTLSSVATSANNVMYANMGLGGCVPTAGKACPTCTIEIAPSVAGGEPWNLVMARQPSIGVDTVVGDAFLLGVKVWFVRNKL